MKLHKSIVFLAIILLVGAFLRFYKIEEHVVFHGELGSNYIAIKNFLLTAEIPLVGPPTSHPWLYFGPLYYWIISPFFAIFDFNPVVGSYFFAFIGTLTIFINYIFAEKIFNKKVALVSSLIVAISPIYLEYARESRFFSIVLILFYPFYYFFLKVVSEKKSFFWFGFFYGLFFSFHYSPLIYFPVILISFWKIKNSLKLKNIANVVVGFVLPNVTIFLSDLTGKTSVIPSLIVWIPYRLLGFLNIIPKNNWTRDVTKINLESINVFFNSIFFSKSLIYPLGVLMIVLVIVLVYKTLRIIPESIKLLYMILFFGLLTLFIHGDFPQHYFLPLIPVCILLFSIAASISFERHRYFAFFFFFSYVFVNLIIFFENGWYYSKNKYNIESVNYDTQYEVSKKIVNDSNGKPFSLKRVGKGDEFEENFAQNYMYLMWYLGNEPVKNSKLTYTIFENVKVENPFIVLENVQVLKNEK